MEGEIKLLGEKLEAGARDRSALPGSNRDVELQQSLMRAEAILKDLNAPL